MVYKNDSLDQRSDGGFDPWRKQNGKSRKESESENCNKRMSGYHACIRYILFPYRNFVNSNKTY